MTDHLARWAQHTRQPKKPRKPGTVLEKDIQKAIVKALQLHRVTLWVTDAGMAGARTALEGARAFSSLPPGFPDLVGVAPGGRAVFVEVKRPGNKPTTLQAAFIERRRAEGAIAFWADSVESALAQYKEQAA